MSVNGNHGLNDVKDNEKKSIPSRYASGTKSHKVYIPIVVLIFIIYFIYLFIVSSSTAELIPILPGTAITDIIVLLIVIPLLSYTLILLSPIIAIGYYKLYRLLFGKSKLFFLDMKVQLGDWTTKAIAKRSVTPGLLICAFSQAIINSTLITMWVVQDTPNFMILALFNAAFLALPIVILLLVPLWLLYDSGVMSKTTPEKSLQKRTPETVETIDQFYISKFKGFAGLAFIFSFVSMIVQAVLQMISPVMILFVIFLPFLGIALIIPAQVIYEKLLPYMTRKIHESTKLHKSELTLIKADDCPACNGKFRKK